MHDATITARSGIFDVLATAAQPRWADHSSLALHVARERGHHPPYLFAVLHRLPARPGMPRKQHWLVVDVRTLARSLADDLPITRWSDQPGLVALTLQRDYPHAGGCMARVLANVRAEWRDDGTELAATPPVVQRFLLQGAGA